MERVDIFFKSLFAFIGGFVSWMVGGLGLAFVVLLGMMALDYITGLMVGVVKKELNSRVGTIGFIKKLYVILLISAVYMVEKLVFESQGVFGDGIASAYCFIEFISIVENGGKLGVPLGPVQNVIEVLKGKGKELGKK